MQRRKWRRFVSTGTNPCKKYEVTFSTNRKHLHFCIYSRKTWVAGNGDTRWSNWKPTQRTHRMCRVFGVAARNRERMCMRFIRVLFAIKLRCIIFYACGLIQFDVPSFYFDFFWCSTVFFVVVVLWTNTKRTGNEKNWIRPKWVYGKPKTKSVCLNGEFFSSKNIEKFCWCVEN